MRSILVTVMSIIVCVIAPPIKAQIITRYITPDSLPAIIPGYAEVSYINTKTIAYNPPTPPTPPPPVDEDTTSEGNGVYYYGTPLSVNVSMSDGNFTTTSQGKVWTCRISIPNAKNIGLLFNQFNLTPNAEMYIYNSAGTILKGEIKKEHFTYGNSVTVSSVQGNTLVIYLIERGNTAAFQSSITISKIIAGYLDLLENEEQQSGSGMSTLSFHCSRSVNCIPHVQCYQSKMHSARAVARWFKIDGGQCSGTLINYEASNGRAYFLTAFHCVDENDNGQLEQSEIDNLQFASFQFQFWRIQCNGNINSRGIEFNGAVLRASSRASDVVLLELTEQPGIGDRVSYAGWNRTTSAPDDYLSYIIHHPHGADMRLTTTRRVRTHPFAWNYWQTNYSSGVVTGGSSGSALFNQNGQIVGQLKGGASCCNFTDFSDRFGKFDRSWTGANLSPWLSPNQNLNSTGTLDLNTIEMQGPEFLQCTNPQQYSTITGLEGVTYEWQVTSNLQIISGQGTSTATISGVPNAYSAGSITVILRTPNKGRVRSYTITKYVNVNQGSIIGWYNSPTNSAEPLKPSSRFEFNWNDACYTQYIHTNMQITQGSTVVWQDAGNSGGVTWWQNGNNLSFYFSDLNQYAYFRVTVTNSCGTNSVLYRFRSVSEGCSGGGMLMLSVSPNPSTGDTRISLTEKGKPDKKKDIREIKIIDKSGMLKRQYSYGVGAQTPIINVGGLTPDIYTILAFDGNKWTAAKLSVQ